MSAVQFRTYTDGELVVSADLDQDNDATRQLVAAAITVLLGATSAMPQPGSGNGPLAIVPSSTSLSFTIGGGGQMLFLGQRLVDSCPSQLFPITPNTGGSARVDLVSVQYNQTPTNGQPRDIEGPTGIIAGGTVYSVNESLNYAYSVGTTAAPVGYTPFAQITVPPGAPAIVTGNIQYLLPSMQSLFDAVVGALVSGINGVTGAITIAGTNIGISSPGPGQLSLTNTGVTSVNGDKGDITLVNGAGISITASPGGVLTFANRGVTSLGKQTGDIQLLQGLGITLDQPNSQSTRINNGGVLTVNNITGNIILQGDGSTVTVTQIAPGVFQFADTGIAGPVGPQGIAGPQGAQGQQGPPGPKGDPGPPGQTGPAGAASTVPGPQGARGLPGPAGGVGPAGAASTVPGPTGATGLQGPAGGVGSCYMAVARFNGSSVTVTIPNPLPSGTYEVWAEGWYYAHGGNGTASMSGGGASWDVSSISDGTGSSQGTTVLVDLYGTAIGGQQPTVTMTRTGGSSSDYNGVVKLFAVRVA